MSHHHVNWHTVGVGLPITDFLLIMFISKYTACLYRINGIEHMTTFLNAVTASFWGMLWCLLADPSSDRTHCWTLGSYEDQLLLYPFTGANGMGIVLPLNPWGAIPQRGFSSSFLTYGV